MVELVASGLKREAQVLEIASNLAMMPEIVGGSITSYAGGQLGQDPVRVGTAVRARGLSPNVHLTCVNQDRADDRQDLAQLQALEMHNVFALTGDWPTGGDANGRSSTSTRCSSPSSSPSCAREQGTPFHISCAVSPFKYQREDCLYQYLKLEKKIAAGANLAITQVGWDATKFAELKQYLDERGIKMPLLGNVYVLSRRAAERMATGNPPGCWASPRAGRRAAEGIGSARRRPGARVSSAPRRSVAVLKGIGYAGAYIGGTHDANAHHADHPPRRGARAAVGGVLRGAAVRRDERLLSVQARPAAEADAHVPAHRARRGRQDLAVRAVVEETRSDTAGAARACRARSRWLDRHPALSHLFERFEYYSKKRGLRLPELRQLRARLHGVRLSADLSEADAQRPVRRHA